MKIIDLTKKESKHEIDLIVNDLFDVGFEHHEYKTIKKIILKHLYKDKKPIEIVYCLQIGTTNFNNLKGSGCDLNKTVKLERITKGDYKDEMSVIRQTLDDGDT